MTHRAEVAVVKEPTSLFCVLGRHWVDTDERVPMFAEPRPSVWICPPHRAPEVTGFDPSSGESTTAVVLMRSGPGPTVAVVAMTEGRSLVGVEHHAQYAAEALKVLTQADLAADERNGPYRRIVEVVRVNPGGVSARVRLECGHEVTGFAKSTRARCRKCRPKEEVAS